MNNNIQIIYVLCILLAFSGCSYVTETAKVILGTSTRALEQARDEALHKTYQCTLEECFDGVLALARSGYVYVRAADKGDVSHDDEKIIEVPQDGYYDVFLKDRFKRHIIVMGIAGNVNTTEVGIFFSRVSPAIVKVEVSSLSSSAKRKVAEAVFSEFDRRFSITAN